MTWIFGDDDGFTGSGPFTRVSSGLPPARLRAVEALSALVAKEVLIDLLDATHDRANSVEQLSDDEAVNSVACAFGDAGEERDFDLPCGWRAIAFFAEPSSRRAGACERR